MLSAETQDGLQPGIATTSFTLFKGLGRTGEEKAVSKKEGERQECPVSAF